MRTKNGKLVINKNSPWYRLYIKKRNRENILFNWFESQGTKTIKIPKVNYKGLGDYTHEK